MKIRKPTGGKYVAPPQCDSQRKEACESNFLYADGKPFLYRLHARVLRNGATIVESQHTVCEKHRQLIELDSALSPDVKLEWEIVPERDSKARWVRPEVETS